MITFIQYCTRKRAAQKARGRGNEILINKWLVCIWKFSVVHYYEQWGGWVVTLDIKYERNVWMFGFRFSWSPCHAGHAFEIWCGIMNVNRYLYVSCRFECILLRGSFDDSRQMNTAVRIDNHLDWLFKFSEIIYCFTVEIEARLVDVDDVKILFYMLVVIHSEESWFNKAMMTISNENVKWNRNTKVKPHNFFSFLLFSPFLSFDSFAFSLFFSLIQWKQPEHFGSMEN